jgi:uncharacterized membrane protein
MYEVFISTDNPINFTDGSISRDELMDVIAAISGDVQIMLGFFLLLFVPGFAVSFVFFPHQNDIPLIERLIYSTVLSIGLVIILVLFMDVVLGINTTPRNISIIICAFSVIGFITWQCEKMYGNSRLKRKLDSLISMDYYRMWGYFKRFKDSIDNHVRQKKENNF